MISEDPNSPTHSEGNRSNLCEPTDDIETIARYLMMFSRSLYNSHSTTTTVSNNDTSMNPVLATPITTIPSNATVSPVVGNTFYESNMCEKSFSSYQALGGHKTKHRNSSTSNSTTSNISVLNPSGRPHECSICHEIFLTGQALGAHKRLHRVIGGDKKTNCTDEDVNEVLDDQPLECDEDIDDQPSCDEDVNEFLDDQPSRDEDVNEFLDDQPLECDEDIDDQPSCDEDVNELLDDEPFECDEDIDDQPSCDEDVNEVLDEPFECDEDIDDQPYEDVNEVLDNQPLECDEDMDDLPSCDGDIDEVLDDQLLGCDEDNIGGGKGSNIEASGQSHCENNVRDFDLNMPALECDENINEVLEDQPLECDEDIDGQPSCDEDGNEVLDDQPLGIFDTDDQPWEELEYIIAS